MELNKLLESIIIKIRNSTAINSQLERWRLVLK